MNVDDFRKTLGRHFDRLKDMGGGILRGEQSYNGKPYAIAYFDISDEIIERSENLSRFQERLLGDEFFSSENDFRWNSYLYFWAGPRSKANARYLSAKRNIEADRHFARKFVLDSDDLTARLGAEPELASEGTARKAEVADQWVSLLRDSSLGCLLEQKPRTTALELIESGKAFVAEGAHPIKPATFTKDPLATGKLKSLRIDTFRKVHSSREFSFADVNLIVAPNGMGKTSLLEAVEVLYCGRVRRDPDAEFKGIEGEIELPDGMLKTVRASTAAATC